MRRILAIRLVFLCPGDTFPAALSSAVSPRYESNGNSSPVLGAKKRYESNGNSSPVLGAKNASEDVNAPLCRKL